MSLSQQNELLLTFVCSFTFIGVIVIPLIVMILKCVRKKVLTNRIPGPPGLFIIGNILLVIKGPEFVLKHFFREYRNYEKSIYKFWVFNRLSIVLTKPEHIQMVLTDQKYLNKSMEYDIFQESILGQGLLTIRDKNKWKHNKKIITKGLDFTLLKSFIPIMYEEANYLAEVLQEKRDRITSDCDVIGPITLEAIEIIGRTTMGVMFNAQRGGRNPFVESLHRIMQTWEYRISHPWYLNKTLYRFSSVKRQHDRSRKIIVNYIDDIIKSKSNELNQSERTNEMNTITQDEDSYRKIQTVIEILLQNSNEMSHGQIRDEIITIMNGGQDTTSMVNSCVLLMFAFHQDVQDKAYEELQSIFPADDDRHRPPTYADLQQMKYLERVINETMRLYPPVPLIGRELTEDTEIGGYMCPAGATLVVGTLGLHTSPLYYDNPDRFDPDNFLPEVVRNRQPYTWLPFSAGMRNCIGSKFAMFQMKTTLSTLLRRFKFSPSKKCPTPEHMRIMFMIMQKFVDGCHVKIEPRK